LQGTLVVLTDDAWFFYRKFVGIVSFKFLVLTSFFLFVKFVGRLHLVDSIALDLFCFILFDSFLGLCFYNFIIIIRVLNLTVIKQLVNLI
jgi:hypothetical protein